MDIRGAAITNTMTPLTPSRPNNKMAATMNLQIELLVKDLNREWDFGLDLPNSQNSPSKKPPSAEKSCLTNLKFLCFRSEIDIPYRQFQQEAKVLYQGWVNKPKAERGVIPKTNSPRPVTSTERSQLLQLFLRLTTPIVKERLETDKRTWTPGKHRGRNHLPLTVDDTPIALQIPTQKPQQSKRTAEGGQEARIMKSKRHRSSSKEALEKDNPFVKPALPKIAKTGTQTYDLFSRAPSEGSIPTERGRQVSHESGRRRSANTSFASSYHDSIFDWSTQDENFQYTQETVPDIGNSNITESKGESQSSENFGSSFDPSTVDQLDQLLQIDIAAGAELEADTMKTEPDPDSKISPQKVSSSASNREKLVDRLTGIFPDSETIPKDFFAAPLHVRYEILRVFLYTGVPLSFLKLPLRKPDWTDYSTLCNILRKLPVMDGKVFPEKVGNEVWHAANNGFQSGHHGVTMTGSLRYNTSSTGPLFLFQLEPLKLDRTHRLGRRFGCDRFLEIDIPRLSGTRIPQIIKDVGENGEGRKIILEWFVTMHQLMRRIWQYFVAKKLDTKKKKGILPQSQPEIDSESRYRLYFFAIDGDEFLPNKGTPKANEDMKSRSAWSVEKLLNFLRPTLENSNESVTKLDARTPLGLSRNTATLVIDRAKIKYMPDIKNEKMEVMTDGAGRVSPALAMKIAQALGLSFLPSGFQGRLGDAKGFWSINHQDRGLDEWIEVYDKQRKWIRKGLINDVDFNDPAHRTFEVNKFSGKLKSADLNQQLMPILMDRAKLKPQMIKALKNLVEVCLRNEIDKERIAMDNPQAFRKWVRDSNPSISDRVKYGCVPYRGAIPDSPEERMNMLLDAGFEPLKLFYLKELAREAYERRCKELRTRLSITITRSTYAFMVPDWTGSLKEGEVFLHSSESLSEDDQMSLFSGMPLEGDVLVARMPAHFPSDIQRVKAVLAKELLGLRDVVVFSTKGDCLADKLSGGDYDGDQAWICWESTIVENFENAKVPKCPDLVKKGYISKDTTTYAKLVRGQDDPTTTYLSYCIEFNLRDDLVGMCTNYKEKWCYTNNTIHGRDAIWLSKLLSDLVDQAKSGYTFTDAHFKAFKERGLNTFKVNEPAYMSGVLDRKSKHVIDQLMVTTQDTVDAILTEFTKSLPESISSWDKDLADFSNWINAEAATNREWIPIISKLKSDLQQIKSQWAENMGGRSKGIDEAKPAFGPMLADIYRQFQAIQPAEDTPLTRVLVAPWSGRPELSQWALMRASFLFSSYTSFHVSKFVWWMCGIQLCHMKALKKSTTTAVTPEMYAMLRPDSTYVKLKISEKGCKWDAPILDEDGTVGDDD
jgi:hypothetical protein